MNGNISCLSINRDAFARKVAELSAADFKGGIHRRCLPDLPDEARNGASHLVLGELDLAFGEHLARHVLGVGGYSEQ